MAEQEQCKAQRHICRDLWTLSDEKQDEKIRGMEKALELNSKEVEKRMHLLNSLREEFSRKESKFLMIDIFTTFKEDEHSDLKIRITKLEQRAVVWIGVMSVVFIALQFFFRIWKP